MGGGNAGPRNPVPDKPVWLAVGPVTVPQGEDIGGVVAIGPVTVAGKVKGDVTSFGGKIVLERTAVVGGNVTAVCAPVEKAEGATVGGEVRQNELPEMASTALDPQDPDAARLLIGSQEVTGAEGTRYIVLGGAVTVKGEAKVADILGVGAAITLAPAVEVDTIRGVAVEVRRPEGAQAKPDEIVEPLCLVCGGRGAVGGGAAASSTMSLNQSTASVRLDAQTGGGATGHVGVSSAGPSSQVNVLLTTKAVPRFGPFPEDPIYAWPTMVPTGPDEASPLLRESFLVGAGMSINASLISVAEANEGEPAGQQRSLTRTIALAVPADAVVLAQAGGYGAGYGTFGGYYGGGGYGGFRGPTEGSGGGQGGRD